MKYPILFACAFFSSLLGAQHEKEAIIISQPVLIEEDDWKFEGSQNLIMVPENRNDPRSRMIALHFFHFPAIEKSDLSPVAFLGAGPGEPFTTEVFYDGRRAEAWRYELTRVNRKREVILINQRGNPEAPGLQASEFLYRWSNGGSLDQPFDASVSNVNEGKSYAEAVKYYTSKGIDLRGYDVHHFVDDVDAVRRAIGADKLALIGNSFASQWALAYIQKFPEHVDRAIFSGIEPLDHNYDDPQGRWNVLQRINAYAMRDKKLKKNLPAGGLTEVLKTIISRLEKEPARVELAGEDGKIEKVVVGVDDLRMMLRNPISRSYADDIESWPKYLMEMYHGDFRLLATFSKGRVYNSKEIMIDPLFNNSIGISDKRKALLESRPARRWLGDINASFTSTRDICPSPKVSDSFRQHVRHKIPIILIQGDMDLSTPYENATFLMDYLENGHLITVERGYHNAKRALIFTHREIADQIFDFMDLDFTQEDFQKYRSDLPANVAMPGYEFWPLGGESLYDGYLKKKEKR